MTREVLLREDLLATGWKRAHHKGCRCLHDELWSHPEVRDGHPHELREAIQAEKIRRTRDGGG